MVRLSVSSSSLGQERYNTQEALSSIYECHHLYHTVHEHYIIILKLVCNIGAPGVTILIFSHRRCGFTCSTLQPAVLQTAQTPSVVLLPALVVAVDLQQRTLLCSWLFSRLW